MTTEHYLDADTYLRLIAALADLKPGALDRDRLDADEIKLALGEIAGIWPVTAKSENFAMQETHS